MLAKLTNLLTLFQEEKERRDEMQTSLITAVTGAIEEHAKSNGNITHHSVCAILQSHQDKIDNTLKTQSEEINNKMTSILASLQGHPPRNVPNSENAMFTQHSPTTQNHLHQWGGRFYHVPEHFIFPVDCCRKRAWDMWLLGQPSYRKQNGDIAPIMPYRLLNPKYLPMKLATKLKVEWKPVLKMMSEAPDLPLMPEKIVSSEVVEESYGIATEYLKKCSVSYIWEKYKRCDSWRVSTWSKRVGYSEIRKNGNAIDRLHLPEETKYNRKRRRVASAIGSDFAE